MPPLKRKRPHDDASETSNNQSQTRRATRQTPILPPPIPPVHHMVDQKRGRGRPPASAPAQTVTQVPRPPVQVLAPPPQQQQSPPTSTKWGATLAAPSTDQGSRVTRQRGPNVYVDRAGIASKENVQPVNLVAPEITYQVPNQAGRTTSSLVRPHPPSGLQPISQPTLPTRPAATTTVVTPIPIPIPIVHKPTPQPPPKQSPGPDRNIDKVVLGNICFKAWYPSFYGKEVLGDTSGHSAKGGSGTNGIREDNGTKVPSRRERDKTPMLDRLYVCPCCFKYSKELVMWWEHVRVCERSGYIPGKKVYTHPKGRRTIRVPVGNTATRGPKKKRGDVGTKYTEEIVQDEGEWSIWEVDGEEDMLFCQNLSLFAKLFLDNKSVFYDVAGFNYFLLVYTPPAKADSSGVAEDMPVRHHITGFFSKEKMSWDNNNLACILVFPPWQRKGLGALLMGVSYEISRREGVLGGPEKPISDLGKKGYKRFWAGEVARWILGLDLSQKQGSEYLMDIDDCSRATWIAPDDCLLVLREMGVSEDIGIGPDKPSDKIDEQGEPEPPKQVQRVRIDKLSIQRWVTTHNITLERTCDPDGFVEGYAMKVDPPVDED
jgi:GNAT superfamily N-acetyltransferase